MNFSVECNNCHSAKYLELVYTTTQCTECDNVTTRFGPIKITKCSNCASTSLKTIKFRTDCTKCNIGEVTTITEKTFDLPSNAVMYYPEIRKTYQRF